MKYVHSRICICQENQKWGKSDTHTVGRWNISRTMTNEKKETQTLQDLEYREKHSKSLKMRITNLGPGKWQETQNWNMAIKLIIMKNEKHTLDDLKNDEITKKREK